MGWNNCRQRQKIDKENVPDHSKKYMEKLNSLLHLVSEKVSGKALGKNSNSLSNDAFNEVQPKFLVGGKLKKYQFQALQWMIELAKRKMNGILADDMGLGKTIQTISYFAYLKEQFGVTGKHLIVAPLTVIRNWERQLTKWLPSVSSVILYATQKERQKTLAEVVKPRKFDILITSYHGLISANSALKKISWECVVIDQAHKMKNDEAILTEAGKQIRGNFKLMLTGTPLSNNLRELWSLLNFIMPQIFHDRQLFEQIQNCVNSFEGTQEQKFQYQCNIAKKFHGIIKPFIKRRTKTEIDLGLPPKNQKTLFVSMTKLQLKMYKNYIKYKNVYGPGKGQQASSAVQFRKICNHPYIFGEIQAKGLPQYGSHLVQTCGKMIVLDKLLTKLISQKKKKNKVIIFSQLVTQLDILEDYCQYRNFDYCRIDGNTSIDQRQQMMNLFNEDEQNNIPIFLISTRAGGLGINLVAANVVIIYDIDWNPQNDNQAMDRAYRIGQKRPVNVYKLITQHTIQERMLEVQKYKLIWDELVIQKGAIVNLKKNQDVLEGLNYQKIAEMKKGQIFKLKEVDQNNMKTIQEIIEMGQLKDNEKYQQIKQKVMKQLAQNKQSINPFEGEEAPDVQGQKLIKSYFSENLRKPQTNDNLDIKKLTKVRFRSSVNLPKHHLYQNAQKIYDLMFELHCTKQKNRFNEEDPKIKKLIQDLQMKIQEEEQKNFINWSQDEFERFVEANRLYGKDELDKITDFVETKSKEQVAEYSKVFYNGNHTMFPQLKNIVTNLSKLNTKQNYQKTQQELFKACKTYEATIYSKRNPRLQYKYKSDIVIQSYLYQLRLQNGDNIQNYQQAKKNDNVMQCLKQYVGEKAMSQKYSKELSSNQIVKYFNLAKARRDLLIQNIHQNKEVYQEKFKSDREAILAKMKKKYKLINK